MKLRAGPCVATPKPGPGACTDCLVPENLLRGIPGQALGVPEGLDLTYPSTPS